MRLVHERKTSKQIAAELGISPKSVDKRLDAARIKLDAATRMDAASLWARSHYGERFPGEPLPVPNSTESVDPTGTEQPVFHQRLFGARLDPERIGPLGRTVIIVVGAGVMLVLILLALAVAEQLFSVLELILGPPGGQ